MGFEELAFPHIRYVGGPKSKKDISGYYMGGEPEENHGRLVVGKQYKISYLWYSPDKNTPRDYVWACKSEEISEHGTNRYANVDPKNFGTIADLRERRINQIID